MDTDMKGIIILVVVVAVIGVILMAIRNRIPQI